MPMKIRTRISLFYTLITMCTVSIVICILYLFTANYITRLYESYLMEKSYLTAQKHWEKDELDEISYQIIERNYNELLPQAYEILLNADSIETVRDTLNKYLNPHQQTRLFSEQIPIIFSYKGSTGAALYYPDNEGNFIVLVTAVNTYGKEIQKHVLLLAITLLLLSSVLTFFMGKIYSGRILLPLQHLLKELGRIRGNNLGKRIKCSGNHDELDKLTASLNEMLDRIDNTLKSEKSFVSNASHELNNPITAIQGECEISLMKQRTPEEYIESLTRIATESERLSQLTRHLLFLSRQENDLLQNMVEDINLAILLSELCEDNSRINFIIQQSGSTNGSFMVSGNYYLTRTAIQNMLDNACKYSEKEVEVILKDKKESIIIEIKDQGIGIPANELPNIFQSFYRASNTRNYAGQGIGLSLSLKILSLYGAKIEVDSQLNAYTHIFITYNKPILRS